MIEGHAKKSKEKENNYKYIYICIYSTCVSVAHVYTLLLSLQLFNSHM